MADLVPPIRRMPRGAIPSSPETIAAARRFMAAPEISAPPSFLIWPSKMSYWGNNNDGDCVSAEEAFAKVVTPPYIFIPESTVINWAKQHGYLNGAQLSAVMTTMQSPGLQVYGGTVFDGPHSVVQWANSGDLQAAIATQGPVKIGVASENFEDNKNGHVTPGSSGWAMFNYPANLREDHCVSLCGYGLLADLVALFKTHGVNVKPPSGMPQGLCYAFFTWDSLGIVDEQSLMNMTNEAWVRQPVTTFSFPTASQFQLKNGGAFVVDIHALYRPQNTANYTEVANKDNFTAGRTETMNLAAKCTNPAIAANDIIQPKVWVMAGSDNTAGYLFLYDPNGPIQRFEITGTTLSNTVHYLGTA